MPEPLLKVENLKVSFKIKKQKLTKPSLIKEN